MKAAYIRKTRDEYEIQQNFGYGDGWECVSTETNIKDARSTLKTYRTEQPKYPARMVKKRVPVNA